MSNTGLSSDFESSWEGLAARHAALPTQDLPWALAALDAFDGELAAFARNGSGPVVGLAPLRREKHRLAFVGFEMFEPSDLLADGADELAALAARVTSDGAAVVLRRVPRDSPTVAALRAAVGARGFIRVEAVVGHPVIALDDRWHELGGGLSSSRRSALRRSRRKAEKFGEVSVELLRPSVEELPSLLEEALAIEGRSWKGEAGTALLHDPERARFTERYAEETAARGTLRLQFLKVGEERIAMQIAVEWKRRLWLFRIGYDEAYAAVAPGRLLLAESIADAARRGLESYDLLGETADWTRAWTDDEHECVTVRLFPPTPRGALELAGGTRTVLRRAGRRHWQELKQATQDRAASRYVAGPDRADALREEAHYAGAGYLTVVGFWGRADTPVKRAIEENLALAEVLPPSCELAIKVPALGSKEATLDELFDRCVERGLALHADALGPETADACLGAAMRLAEREVGTVGCTLTGRWARSVADAASIRGWDLKVRVVKSEWADSENPDRDAVAGCLEVVEQLAGRTGLVAIATHDADLAAAALARLTGAGTLCELQVLHGMNGRAAVREARRLEVPVRVYIPYGYGRTPYSTDGALGDPAIASRIAYDVMPLRPWIGRTRLVRDGQ